MTRYAIRNAQGYVASIWTDGDLTHVSYCESSDFALTFATATEAALELSRIDDATGARIEAVKR